jgi:hypothetical protein
MPEIKRKQPAILPNSVREIQNEPLIRAVKPLQVEVHKRITVDIAEVSDFRTKFLIKWVNNFQLLLKGKSFVNEYG